MAISSIPRRDCARSILSEAPLLAPGPPQKLDFPALLKNLGMLYKILAPLPEKMPACRVPYRMGGIRIGFALLLPGPTTRRSYARKEYVYISKILIPDLKSTGSNTREHYSFVSIK